MQQQTPLAWPVALVEETARRHHLQALLALDQAMRQNVPEALETAWKAAALAAEQEHRARQAAPSRN